MRTLDEIYMLASTPSYLARHYREHSLVQGLALMHTSGQLARKYFDVVALSNRTVADVALGYAYLVALTLKEDGAHFLRTLNEHSGLDWASFVLSYASGGAGR